jgi:aminoglycoside phosphotransferase family enzyme/predicted kinase
MTGDFATQDAVLAFLGDAATHGRPVERIDTHGAIVFLAGDDVYKVKRAVRFPFMDFSTLEKRRLACEAEIAVNRANAPAIYLGVVPIVVGEGGLRIGGAGEPVEWAVHLRRFDETMTFERLAARGDFTRERVAHLAREIVASHARAPIRSSVDVVGALGDYIDQNAAAFAAAPAFFDPARAAALIAKSRRALARASDVLRARAAAGFARRCHGDLHLGNIALIDERPVLFDAIEFDERVATCDVFYDLAFALMDLVSRGLVAEANLLLNRYLWTSDEDAHYRDLSIMPLFMSLRAAIRAKLVFANLDHLDGPARAAAAVEAARLFALAEDALALAPPRLIGIGGLSGAGKSTVAGALAPRTGPPPGAIWLRSDVERKNMFRVDEATRLPAAAYTAAVTAEVYARLRRRAAFALSAGASVIVDAVHARADERDALQQVARDAGAPFLGVWLEAPTDLRAQRVDVRVGDASDANASIARAQASYDQGAMGWRRIDATRDLAAILDVLAGA